MYQNIEKELARVRLEKNVTKAKICEDGNWLETSICKLNRNGSVDPKKARFHEVLYLPRRKTGFFPFLSLELLHQKSHLKI